MVGLKDEGDIDCGGFSQENEYEFVLDYCIKCKNHGHIEVVYLYQQSKEKNMIRGPSDSHHVLRYT